MGIFRQRIAQNLLMANYRAYRVEFPLVQSFTVHVSGGASPFHQGIRHFNRDLSPAIRLANEQLEYNVFSRKTNKETTKPIIEILFKDGSTASYDAWKKDSVQIYFDLIQVAKGKSFIPKRQLPTLQLGKPDLTPVE